MADGSDQPALSGTTLSITVKGPNSWEVVRKMKGRTLLMAHWTLSEDGKTLNDALYAIFARRCDIVLATFAQRFDIVLALRVRADGGKFRFSRHMGQRERESEDGDRAPDPALRG